MPSTPGLGADDRASPEFGARERAIVEEEEQLFAAVCEAIAGAARGTDHAYALQRRMLSLRDEMAGAKADDRAALAAEAQRARATARHAHAGELPDLAMPYFAHMQLENDSSIRDVLLGQRSFIDAESGVTIVDWREAPVAQTFFHYVEGEDYEQDLPGGCVEGVLLKRRVVVFSNGELVEVQIPDGVLRRGADGEWSLSPAEGEEAEPRPLGPPGAIPPRSVAEQIETGRSRSQSAA